MKRLASITTLLTSVILAGCGLLQTTPTTSSPLPIAAAKTISPSPTFKVKNAPLSSPTATTSPDVTPTLRPPAPTARPTLTFVPRPSPEEAEKQFLELLHTNGNCRLPCWFGFTLGQTSIQTLKSHFHGSSGSGVYGIHLEHASVDVFVTLTWNYSDDPWAIVQWLKMDYIVSGKGGEYQENPFYTEPMYPSLPYLLSTYGPPSQVYINFDVGIAEMGLGSDLYFLVLDYTKDGWIATYKMELSRKDGMFVGCKASATLWLWSPKDTETAKEYGFADGTLLKTIEEATSMTLEEFYQQYKDPANTRCLESPVDLYER